MSLNARQQFLFQPSSALPEPLSLHLKIIEEFDDLAVLVTKRVKACTVATNRRTVSSSSENLVSNDRMRSTISLVPYMNRMTDCSSMFIRRFSRDTI